MERSSISGEISPIITEITSMSSADDVLEMKSITVEIADRLVGVGAQMQARVGAVLKAFTVERVELITDNRALEFIKGKARRVEAWEKEHAKRQRDELRERERVAIDSAHFAWLEGEIARHRVPGTTHRGAHVVALEHLLRVARDEAGLPAEDHDQFREWGGVEPAE